MTRDCVTEIPRRTPTQGRHLLPVRPQSDVEGNGSPFPTERQMTFALLVSPTIRSGVMGGRVM